MSLFPYLTGTITHDTRGYCVRLAVNHRGLGQTGALLRQEKGVRNPVVTWAFNLATSKASRRGMLPVFRMIWMNEEGVAGVSEQGMDTMCTYQIY